MRTIREVLDALPTNADGGLDPEAVADSRQRFGANRLTPLPREPLWKKFLDKFDEPIIKVLLAAALLSMFVDLFAGNPLAAAVALGAVALAAAGLLLLRRSEWLPSLMFVSALVLFFLALVVPPHHPSVEGLAVMVAVILATGVAFLSEYRSDREFEVLNAHKESLRAKVVRGGQFHTVSLEEVVVGDLVSLEMGDEVPADGRLVKAADLYVDQSLMTGESQPVHKKPFPDDTGEGFERPGCLYRGTQVVDGVGQMLVTEVGDATHLGQIARHLSAEEEEDEEAAGGEETRVKRKLTISKQMTPLQEKLKKLADLISTVGYVAAVLIFLALLARGLWKHEVFWPADSKEALEVARALLSYFVYMVIIIVVAVPEGLPMSVTVSLALAMRRMTHENALVRQLVACETIGSATVICSDKTGTLTQNRMQVVRLSWDGRVFDSDSRLRLSNVLSRKRLSEPTPTPEEWIVLNAAVNSTANLEEKDGKLVVVGNSTEGALLLWLRDAGIDYAPLRRQFPLLFTIHFSSDRKRMTSVVRHGDRLVSLVKGAPEWVLGHSTHYLAADGVARPWTPEAALAVVRDSSGRAMRTLAFAYAVLPPDAPADEEALHARQDTLESDLVFVGVAAIHDPLRPDVKAAVEECRRAGIEVKMITGDNVETARAIAWEVGLIAADTAIDAPEARVITSAALEALDDERLKARLPKLRVVARARPLDKYRLVKALQELGEVVAVTGDGTNDAPALKRADVGLAMGVAGTEVAKEASKIVLLDDAFSTIVKAVHWGRSLYENIQRFLQFQLTINVSALTIAFLGPFFGVKPPFTVLQLLWINVIMDTFASIALCSEPPRPGVMRQPPKRRDDSILTRPMLWTIFTTAAFFVVVMMALLAGMEWYGWFRGDGDRSAEFPELTVRQVSIFFSVYVLFQVWNQVNSRSLTPEESGLSGLGRNPTFLVIAGTVALVQVLIVSVPFLASVFKVEPLAPVDWLCVVAGTASVLAFAEAAGLAPEVPEMNEFTKTKIHFTLALLGALFALHPFLQPFEDKGFEYEGYLLKLSYAYLLFAGLLALCVYLYAVTLVSERPHSWLERLGNYCYGLAIMSLPFYGGLYLASLLAKALDQSHLAWAAPGAALALGIGWFVLSQVFAWFLRGRLGDHDRSAKVEQFAREEVKALADAQELFASDHFDLAVMQAYRAVEARLRRVLLARGSHLPGGDPAALVKAARRAALLNEPGLAQLQDLQRHWHVAISTEPLTREAAAKALRETRDILAAIPVPKPAEAFSGGSQTRAG